MKLNTTGKGLIYTSRLFLFYGLFIAAWAGTTGVWWTVGLSFPFIIAATGVGLPTQRRTQATNGRS